MTSFLVAWRPPSASYSPIKLQTYPKLDLCAFTATSKWLPVKWRHFRITGCHVRSRDILSCHVTATSCELQPCKGSKVHKTRLVRLPQPLQGEFRWCDVTPGTLPVMWGHIMSFPVTWWPPPASYSPLWAQTYAKLDLCAFYSHIQMTSG